MTDFQLLIVIGDDRTSIHLASGSHHSQYTANRDNLTIRLLKADKKISSMDLRHSEQTRKPLLYAEIPQAI